MKSIFFLKQHCSRASSYLHTKLGRFELSENNHILIAGSVSTFAVKIVGAVLTFVTQILLARMLGANEYGIFAYATSWLIVLAIFAQLGMRDSLIRFIPEYEVQGKPGLLRGVIHFAALRVFIAGAIISLLGIIALWVWQDLLESNKFVALAIMLFVLPLHALNRIVESGLRGFHRAAVAVMPENIIRPFILCMTCGIIFLVFERLFAWQAWICYLAAICAAFMFGSWLLYRVIPHEVHNVEPLYDSKKWFMISLPMLMMSSMNVVLNQSSVIILGFFVSESEIAKYAACTKIVILVSFALTSVNYVIGPMISRLYYSNKKLELQKMLTLAARGIFVITLFVFLFLIMWGKFILGLFGPLFVQGYLALIILLCGQIVNALAGSVALLMNMTGQQNKAAQILFITVTLSLIANFLLIPRYGSTGAAVATAVSTGMWNILMLIFVVKKLKINPTIIAVY